MHTITLAQASFSASFLPFIRRYKSVNVAGGAYGEGEKRRGARVARLDRLGGSAATGSGGGAGSGGSSGVGSGGRRGGRPRRDEGAATVMGSPEDLVGDGGGAARGNGAQFGRVGDPAIGWRDGVDGSTATWIGSDGLDGGSRTTSDRSDGADAGCGCGSGDGGHRSGSAGSGGFVDPFCRRLQGPVEKGR